jgi:hypothetical protein
MLGGDVRRGEKGTNRVRMRWGRARAGRASVAITRQRVRVDKQNILSVFSQNCHPNIFLDRMKYLKNQSNNNLLFDLGQLFQQ